VGRRRAEREKKFIRATKASFLARAKKTTDERPGEKAKAFTLRVKRRGPAFRDRGWGGEGNSVGNEDL